MTSLQAGARISRGAEINKYQDYREMLEKEDIDVVTIGTPDHWHVPIAIAALKAGCDVYCEKPLTLTIDEGKQICKVVKETGKVFQVGSQQRSENELRFLKAIAFVQSGRLGRQCPRPRGDRRRARRRSLRETRNRPPSWIGICGSVPRP